MPTDHWSNPSFQRLSPQAKRLVLERDDPSFASMSQQAKELVIQRGATPSGDGLRTVLEDVGLERWEKPARTLANVVEFAGNTAKTSALPTGLGLAGATAGAFTGPAAPYAIPALESAGSAGGEYLNQVLGITPRSKTQIAMAGAAPLITRGVSGAVRAGWGKLSRSLPGASTVLHEDALRESDDLITALKRKATPSAPLYEQVASQSVDIDAPKYRQALQGMKSRGELLAGPATREAAAPGMGKIVDENLEAFFPPSPIVTPSGTPATVPTSFVPFQRLWETKKALNQLYGKKEAVGGQAFGQVSKLTGAIGQDLESAKLSGPSARTAVEALQKANASYKLERAVDTLDDLFKKAITMPRQGDAVRKLRAGSLIAQLEKTDAPKVALIREAIPSSDMAMIDDFLNRVVRLPPLPAERHVNVGSALTLMRGTGGAAAAKLAGVDPLVGAAVGEVSSPLIARALATGPGRSFLRSQYQKGFTMDWPILATLTQIGRSMTTGEPEKKGQSPELSRMLNISTQLRGVAP